MYPPHIEIQTPYVEIKVALPYNISLDGKELAHPLPQESEIRGAMIEFSENISALYEACEEPKEKSR